MKLLMIIGDSAVGKMTVGQELTKITGLRLFHNHMAIELVLEVFGGFHSRAVHRIRDVVFEEFALTGQEGLIFTLQWAFDQPSDWEYAAHIAGIFTAQGAEVYYAELVAPQAVRLQRNATENRLKHKASKRDIEQSRRRLLEDDEAYRLVSLEGEIPFENYIKIDTAALSAAQTAGLIKERFGL